MSAFTALSRKLDKRFIRIGDGAFSNVFLNADSIFKCSCTVDDGAFAYYSLCKKFPSIYAPRIKRIYSDSFYIAEMEILYELPDDFIPAFIEDYALKYITRQEFIDLANDFPEEIPDAEELSRHIDRIVTLLQNYSLDLHGGNIMQRNNNQIVITDPVAPMNIKTKPKWRLNYEDNIC